MAFQNSSQIQIVVCPSCKGQGCVECANFGVYGLGQDKTLVFGLPGLIDLAKRKKNKTAFLVKRLCLFLITAVVIILAWGLINNL
ncbi:MAG: hypothetical protein M1120_02500 [Patescibacteria group bacterium]|nr:hypothetical protein [Patescibacteria group bacterium]